MGTLVKEDFGHLDRANTTGMRHVSFYKLDDDGLAPPIFSCSGRLQLIDAIFNILMSLYRSLIRLEY
jgi:hypothetical protein